MEQTDFKSWRFLSESEEPRILWNMWLSSWPQNSPPLLPALSHIYPTPCNIISKAILKVLSQLPLRLPSCHLHSDFPTERLNRYLLSTTQATWPAHLTLISPVNSTNHCTAFCTLLFLLLSFPTLYFPHTGLRSVFKLTDQGLHQHNNMKGSQPNDLLLFSFCT